MSDKNIARRATAEINFDGTDITKNLKDYFLSMTYTDNEEDEADDLQIKLQDRNGQWMQKWLNASLQSAASGGIPSTTKGLRIKSTIVQSNWNGDGRDRKLSCGQFELDGVAAVGPPNTISIKATALPYDSTIRQQKKSKAWEGYRLSGIASEMASSNGMLSLYEADQDPEYDRVEQITQSDICFLQTLCHKAGISLKVTDNMLVLFDQRKYEAKDSVYDIIYGAKSVLKWNLGTGEAKTQYQSCRVSYTKPDGSVIEGIATAEIDGGKDNKQCLEVSAVVASVGEAKELASKMLRLRNKFERTSSFTLVGNVGLVSGLTVKLEGWGMWDGKAIIKKAVHIVGDGGYTTQITVRRVLEGY